MLHIMVIQFLLIILLMVFLIMVMQMVLLNLDLILYIIMQNIKHLLEIILIQLSIYNIYKITAKDICKKCNP